MNRLIIAVILIIIAVSLSIASLFYIDNTYNEMIPILDTALESAMAENKYDTKKQIAYVLSQWEKHDDILNVILGQNQTSEVKGALKTAYYFAQSDDMKSVILYINEGKVEIERIKNANTPSISTIL